MFVELFILFVILFIIYFEFNTLSHIFVQFVWRKLSFTDHSSSGSSKSKQNDKTSGKGKNKKTKLVKNEVKSTKIEARKTSKKGEKPKNKEQEKKKVDKPVSMQSDKSVKVTTDKKLTKTLPLPQEAKKDKRTKNKKSVDKAEEWIVVQKKARKSHFSRTNEANDASTVTNMPNKGFKTSELVVGGKPTDTKPSNIVKPLYKELVTKTPSTANPVRSNGSFKTNSTETQISPKSAVLLKNETNRVLNKENLSNNSKISLNKKTNSELALGFYLIKGNKAENDSKQYLDFANQNKRKFQTDYAKTVYKKPNAWLDKSKTILNNELNKINHDNESNILASKDSIIVKSDNVVSREAKHSENQAQNSCSNFIEPNNSSNIKFSSNSENVSALNEGGDTVMLEEAPVYVRSLSDQVSNKDLSASSSPDIGLMNHVQNYDNFGNLNVYSSYAREEIENNMVSPNVGHTLLPTSFVNEGAQVFASCTAYGVNFPALYSQGGFIEMPLDALGHYKDSSEKGSCYEENKTYLRDEGHANYTTENLKNSLDHLITNRTHSSYESDVASYETSLNQYVSDSNPAFYHSSCDINVNEKNYGLSDELEDAGMKFDLDNSVEVRHDTSDPFLSFREASVTHHGSEELEIKELSSNTRELNLSSYVFDACEELKNSSDNFSASKEKSIVFIEEAIETSSFESPVIEDDSLILSENLNTESNIVGDVLSSSDEEYERASLSEEGNEDVDESPFSAKEEDSQADESFSSTEDENNPETEEPLSSEEENEDVSLVDHDKEEVNKLSLPLESIEENDYLSSLSEEQTFINQEKDEQSSSIEDQNLKTLDEDEQSSDDQSSTSQKEAEQLSLTGDENQEDGRQTSSSEDQNGQHFQNQHENDRVSSVGDSNSEDDESLILDENEKESANDDYNCKNNFNHHVDELSTDIESDPHKSNVVVCDVEEVVCDIEKNENVDKESNNSSKSSSVSNSQDVNFHDNYFELHSNEEIAKILGKSSVKESSASIQELNDLIETNNDSLKSIVKENQSEAEENKLILEQLSDALLEESELNQPETVTLLDTNSPSNSVTGLETNPHEPSNVGSLLSENDENCVELVDSELAGNFNIDSTDFKLDVNDRSEATTVDEFPAKETAIFNSCADDSLKFEVAEESNVTSKHSFISEALNERVSETLSHTVAEKNFAGEGISEETNKNSNILSYKSEIDCLGKARPQKMLSSNIRVLTLNDGEHKDSTLYRLEKDWILEFRVGPSLFGRKVKIFVNFPEKGQEFHRNVYHGLTWSNCSGHDDCAKFCQIQLTMSGSFHYYFSYDNEDSKKGSGYFLVDPVLTAGGEVLPLDCIQSVTYLSKLLGPFSSWENKLRVAKESGYNMIHFTPIQELGGSHSAYSLRNQLTLNVTFNQGNREITYDDVTELTNKLRNEWKVLSICDIVLNHTANESPWLKEHPECTYNLVNSPHLKPAYLLDITLNNLSKEIAQGKWEYSGIPSVVNCEDHLSALKHALYSTILPKVKIFELFTLDIDKIVVEFQSLSRSRVPPSPTEKVNAAPLKIIADPEFRRLAAKVDMELALSLFNTYRSDCFDEETRLKKCSEEFKKSLQKLNDAVYNKVQSDLGAAVENFIAGVRYFRVQADGPRLTEISEKNPLSPRYFTDPPNGPSEEIMYTPDARFVMAHNGWVMNADPLQNFAAPGSDIYLRRELIAWGDSVKLRYGEKPADCPFLWNLMTEYVERTVKAFDGVRLDNCHSTPIAVAQHLLDAGRRIKPNLYVVGELFTNSDDKDNIFVNKLGITSLIREAMSAWDSHEEGRLVYRYGGLPVGAFVQPASRPLVPSVAHALFLDLTHDNPSPIEKRTVFDLLPSSALVSMACCASGSNMGYDLLVPHHIHVVDEIRLYLEWGKDVNLSTGIIGGKRALNNLHYTLGKEGYSQVFVDQIDSDIVCVTRHNDITHETVILVAYTAFHQPNGVATGIGKGVSVSGHAESVLLEATLSHRGGQKYAASTEYKRNPKYINGLDEYSLDLRENIDLKESIMLDFVFLPDGSTRVNFTSQFKPGSVVAVKFNPHAKVLPALQKLSTKQDLSHVISQLSLVDLNKALYCCAEEEGGCYDVPNFGRFVYAGIQGVVSPLSTIAPNNDLGHPVCENLRNGHWLMDYISSRLKNYAGTKPLGDCLEQLFAPLKDIPRFLVPSYFNLIIMQIYEDLLNQVWTQMSEFVSDGSAFSKNLALGSVQLGGIVSSSPLPLLSSNLLPPKPATKTTKDGRIEQLCASLSAGLPHFSHGYMRNWGRDTFIALRGLFLLTGRYQEARYIILAFGGCLRHGLIPNLLDGGNNPRFNCRDAVWWWLYTIQSYVEIVPQGHVILNDVVNRIFPTDDSPNTSVDQVLHDVIQEAMSVHFQGLCFRERNAGTAIDAHMVSQGFDNQIGVNPITGFVFGGNEWNCGTWMDKMGSSEKAGTKGRPATPRDGSAIELIGLCKAAVRWLAAMNEKNHFPHSGVTRTNKDGTTTTWTYAEWNERIQNNFEKHFWISLSSDPNEKRPDLVNRKGIYKDTFGATQPWNDYQLRPNFPVAMVVAPELFTPKNAWAALETVEKILLGPLGMKTLDPTDWCYDGNYDNSNDSSDAKVAHGFNYHQGPEWLWPVGFFLRAQLIFAVKAKGHSALSTTISKILAFLSRHYSVLQSSVWRGLPELTNKDGAFCPGSCTVQAWSMSTILEVLDDISKLEVEAEFESINDSVK